MTSETTKGDKEDETVSSSLSPLVVSPTLSVVMNAGSRPATG